MTYFITSDVHSFYNELITALDEKGFDKNNKDHILIICGDLFDRGPDSKKLLKFVQSLDDRFIYISGNHEDLLSGCVYEMVSGKSVGIHHYSNGTVKTIAQLCDIDEKELRSTRLSDDIKYLVNGYMKRVLSWINEKSINYYELGDYIFVHGWIPTDCDGIDCFGKEKNPRASKREYWDTYPDCWKEAKWSNGMAMWKKGVKIPGKTIVCGHFHSSWGHSHLHQDRKEFPPKNRKDWQKSFEPFIEDGIIALDACTVYSGFVNVLKIEV